jgi:hypothetical protein
LFFKHKTLTIREEKMDKYKRKKTPLLSFPLFISLMDGWMMPPLLCLVQPLWREQAGKISKEKGVVK